MAAARSADAPPLAEPHPTAQPTAVPDWSFTHPGVPNCKCVTIVPRHSMRPQVDFPGLQFTESEQIVIFRCKWLKRKNGCNKGDSCTHCHVDPVELDERDHSQRIRDEHGKVQKMHRHERAAQRQSRTDEDFIGQHAYRQLKLAMQ